MLEETRRAVEIAEGVGFLSRVLGVGGVVVVVLCFKESLISVFGQSLRSVGEVVAPAALSSVETPV